MESAGLMLGCLSVSLVSARHGAAGVFRVGETAIMIT